MSSRLRRACGDVAVSAGVLGLVLAVLMSVDLRVREQVRAAVTSASPTGVADVRTQLRDVASALFDAARTQSVEHAPMMIFIVAASVLLLWMVRT